MWAVKSARKQTRKETSETIAKGRLIERLFGFEYTAFEKQQINEFNNAKNADMVELSGYVSWIDRTRFLLLPTRTTNSIYIICKAANELKFPPNHKYVHCKGRWKYERGVQSVYKGLVIESIKSDKPDHNKFSPDIKSSDFVGNLFENWINVDPIQQNFLAQYFVSSPPSPRRVGGFTTSLFSAPRELKVARTLYRDLRTSVAPELLGSKKPIFEIPELKRSHELRLFEWNETSSDFEELSQNTRESLNRKPNHSFSERSIALLSNRHKPKDFQSLGLVKSDYPITIEEYVERRGSPYTSLKMTQFLIAAHLNSPSIEQKIYDDALVHARKEIKKFTEAKGDLAAHLLGPNKMLNLDFDGKPSSILNLAVSRQRLLSTKTVNESIIVSTTNDYIKNLDRAFKIWDEKTAGGAINPFVNQLGLDEEKILGFLYKEGPRTFDEICKATGLSHDACNRAINYLYYRANLIYQYSQTEYDVIDR